MLHRGPAFRLAPLAILLVALAAGPSPGQAASPTAVADVAASVEALRSNSATLAFDVGSTEFPRGGHLQGIQLRYDAAKERYLVYLTHDSDTVGYLTVVAFAGGLQGRGGIVAVHDFPSDGRMPPLRHAGGMQLAGDVLAVGLEDNQQKTRSEVQFWNVADAERLVQLPHLTIRRNGSPKDMTAGAVGFIERKAGHLAAVANWDSRAIDFYAANGKPLADAACRFEHRVRWCADEADKAGWQGGADCGAYQAVNLLAGGDGRLYLLGFDTTAASRDVVDLFVLDLAQSPQRLLKKLARVPIAEAPGARFDFAAGLFGATESWPCWPARALSAAKFA